MPSCLSLYLLLTCSLIHRGDEIVNGSGRKLVIIPVRPKLGHKAIRGDERRNGEVRLRLPPSLRNVHLFPDAHRRLRIAIPASPISPLPSASRLPGSGTGPHSEATSTENMYALL